MSVHLEIREDCTLDVSWHDLQRVLSVLGYRNVPNHSSDIITYWNDIKNKSLTIFKENRYNADYFHEILAYVDIDPDVFVRIAFSNK